MKVISTQRTTVNGKKDFVLHVNLTSIVHNLICKVNKHVPLQLRLDSMAVSMLLSATLQYQKYLYLRSFQFRNFANGSERTCKGLSAFTGKFPLSAAGLHLVLKTSCLRKKSCLVRYRMVECFHAITINAKRLHFKCEQYCIILLSRNKSFSRNPFEFLHIRESLVSRSSILETRSSNVSSIEARGSSLEFRVSTYF